MKKTMTSGQQNARIYEIENAAAVDKIDQASQDEMVRRKILMDVSLDGFVILDQHYQVLEANHRFTQMLGYTPEELLNLHVWDWDASLTKVEIKDRFKDLSATKTTFETSHRRKDGSIYDAEVTSCGANINGESVALAITRDISERKKLEQEKNILIERLQASLSELKKLQGIIPICASCKNIRDDQGYWKKVEEYLRDHSDAEFTHSICPECTKKLYPELKALQK